MIEDNPAVLFSIIASFSRNELHFGGGKGGGWVHGLSFISATPKAAPVDIAVAFFLSNDNITSFLWKRCEQEIAPCFSSW